MKLGITGAGYTGGTLTRRLTAPGHKVSVATSGGRAPRAARPPGSAPQPLADLARETGATTVTVEEAARRADVVILTIPQKNIPSLPADLFKRPPASVVVVVTWHYYPSQRARALDDINACTLLS